MLAPVIDTHAHVIASDERRYPRAPLGGKQSDWSRERPVSAEAMLAAMERAGIERTVLVQASTCYGHDNSYLADAVAAHRQRFIGVFSVDVLAPEAPVRIRQWLERGLAGLRVFIAGHTTAQDLRLDDPRAFPAWEYASGAALPICVQLRAPALGQLQGMLERFPRARVLLDHMARPDYQAPEALLALARYENLYLKLTTHNVREAPQNFFARVVKSYGAARIIWGSNFPAAEGALEALVAQARAALASLSPQEHDWIFSRSARNFYAALG
ncbi:MAG TPA: amidohydrolase family protein [Burkholderiales bacterium]|nr:amidohydrolase family protein [Burkholderiales bacterium]